MKCILCEHCIEHPQIPGMCIYGGPFTGYLDCTTEEGRKEYEAMADKATRENYWSTQ